LGHKGLLSAFIKQNFSLTIVRTSAYLGNGGFQQASVVVERQICSGSAETVTLVVDAVSVDVV